MKELKEFTLEQLESMIESDHAQTGDVAALAKIALAAKQAQIVAWEVKGIFCHTREEASIYVGEPEPLYDAPPLNHTERHLEAVKCNWSHDDDYVYSTSCGNEWQFTEGGIEENEITYCPYCSGKIAAPKPEM